VIAGFVFVALAQAQADLPLRVGSRWTYAQDGKEVMAIEIVGREQTATDDFFVARIRGQYFFLYSQEDLWLSNGGDGVRIHGEGHPDQMTRENPPLTLLPAQMEKGASWQAQPGRKVAATVQGLEAVRVPAGDFKAWKIEYVWTGGSGTEYSYRAWFAAGTGFVKIELWQQLSKGEKKPTESILELVRYEPERRIRPLPPSDLTQEDRAKAEQLIGRLKEDQVADRTKVVSSLVDLGRGVLPLIRDRIAGANDPEVAGRLKEVLEAFPKVEISVRKLGANGSVGKPCPISFALRNLTDSRIQVLPSLGGLNRYPRYTIEIRDEKGDLQNPSKGPRVICGFENPIDPWDFVTLEPGEECDPFGPGTMGHALSPWIPERPGTYTVVAAYDASGDVPDAWKGSIVAMEARAHKLLTAMPRGRFESKRLTIVIDP